MKDTQPLPSASDSPTTHPLSLLWRRSRWLVVAGAAGAASTFVVSMMIAGLLSSAPAPKSMPKPAAKKTPAPTRMTLDEWRRQNPSDAAFVDAAVVPEGQAPSDVRSAAVEVAESNEDGTAWRGFVARTDDDRRRLDDRRDEDSHLSARRVLEDQKKRVERELEIRALREKFRQEDKELAQQRREEDRGRVQARVDEDRKVAEERERTGEQLAEAPDANRDLVPDEGR